MIKIMLRISSWLLPTKKNKSHQQKPDTIWPAWWTEENNCKMRAEQLENNCFEGSLGDLSPQRKAHFSAFKCPNICHSIIENNWKFKYCLNRIFFRVAFPFQYCDLVSSNMLNLKLKKKPKQTPHKTYHVTQI